MKKVIIIILLFVSYFSSSAAILMKPYLQAVTTNSVYILVECDSREPVTVFYGLQPSYGNEAVTGIISETSASPVTYVHKVRLTGLTADSKYYYKAKQGNSVSAGYSFHTAVNPGTKFRFAWLADCRTGGSIHDKIDSLILCFNPLFSLYGGDLCVNSSYSSWKSQFFRPNEQILISLVPFFNATGNHEGTGPNTEAFLQSPPCSSNTQQYYSFDYGDLHVLCINTEIPDNEGSPQYKYAAADLATTTKPWKIVISHEPAYCSGGHGKNAAMVALTKNVFEPDHVNLVISGHSHFYQHNIVNGIHHLVIGSAGAPLYEPVSSPFTLLSVKDYNFAIADISADTLTINVYNEDNKKLDSLKLVKTSVK